MKANRDKIIWWLVFCTAAVTAMAVADSSATATTSDPLLSYMQAAGFPTWAVVVAWGVYRITNEIKSISYKLDTFIIHTDRRLVRLEAKLNLLDGPKDFAP